MEASSESLSRGRLRASSSADGAAGTGLFPLGSVRSADVAVPPAPVSTTSSASSSAAAAPRVPPAPVSTTSSASSSAAAASRARSRSPERDKATKDQAVLMQQLIKLRKIIGLAPGEKDVVLQNLKGERRIVESDGNSIRKMAFSKTPIGTFTGASYTVKSDEAGDMIEKLFSEINAVANHTSSSESGEKPTDITGLIAKLIRVYPSRSTELNTVLGGSVVVTTAVSTPSRVSPSTAASVSHDAAGPKVVVSPPAKPKTVAAAASSAVPESEAVRAGDVLYLKLSADEQYNEVSELYHKYKPRFGTNLVSREFPAFRDEVFASNLQELLEMRGELGDAVTGVPDVFLTDELKLHILKQKLLDAHIKFIRDKISVESSLTDTSVVVPVEGSGMSSNLKELLGFNPEKFADKGVYVVGEARAAARAQFGDVIEDKAMVVKKATTLDQKVQRLRVLELYHGASERLVKRYHTKRTSTEQQAESVAKLMESVYRLEENQASLVGGLFTERSQTISSQVLSLGKSIMVALLKNLSGENRYVAINVGDDGKSSLKKYKIDSMGRLEPESLLEVKADEAQYFIVQLGERVEELMVARRSLGAGIAVAAVPAHGSDEKRSRFSAAASSRRANELHAQVIKRDLLPFSRQASTWTSHRSPSPAFPVAAAADRIGQQSVAVLSASLEMDGDTPAVPVFNSHQSFARRESPSLSAASSLQAAAHSGTALAAPSHRRTPSPEVTAVAAASEMKLQRADSRSPVSLGVVASRSPSDDVEQPSSLPVRRESPSLPAALPPQAAAHLRSVFAPPSSSRSPSPEFPAAAAVDRTKLPQANLRPLDPRVDSGFGSGGRGVLEKDSSHVGSLAVSASRTSHKEGEERSPASSPDSAARGRLLVSGQKVGSGFVDRRRKKHDSGNSHGAPLPAVSEFSVDGDSSVPMIKDRGFALGNRGGNGSETAVMEGGSAPSGRASPSSVGHVVSGKTAILLSQFREKQAELKRLQELQLYLRGDSR